METYSAQPLSKIVSSQPVKNVFGHNACRAGLETINSLKTIFLKQKIDALEIFTGWQVKNKFRLTDPSSDQIIGLFKEDSECCQRQCCKNMRSFDANIVSTQNQILFKINRPFHCACFCCPNANDGCCGQAMTIFDNQSIQIGKVFQNAGCSGCIICCLNKWSLTITDQFNKPKYIMKNDLCHLLCVPCCDDKFLPIYNMGGDKVGQVVKRWRGCCTEMCTPADSLLIEFPEDATAELKCSLIAATLLTDYNLWEQQNNK